MLRLEARNSQTPIERKPPWIKTRLRTGPEYTALKKLVQREGLHTVCKPSARTRPLSSVYAGPVRTRVLIHGGFRSIGVSLLRASRRSIRRPSGASSWVLTTSPGYAVARSAPDATSGSTVWMRRQAR